MSKVQFTAKNVLHVLEWIETHGHHIGALTHTRAGANAFCLSGYTHKLIIPYDIWDQAAKYVGPGSEFDTRMYRANDKGRRLLSKNGIVPGTRYSKPPVIWIEDDNGNRASVNFWGSKKKAMASLATLKHCTDCTDCENCENCNGCSECKNCEGCTKCRNCEKCYGCLRCTNCNNCADLHYCKDEVGKGSLA